MNREARITYLNRVLSATSNSLLQYLSVATPYVPPECEDQMEEVARLIDEEAQQVARIVDLIEERDGVPSAGIFPFWNVDLNYLDFRFLARFAEQKQGEIVDGLERDLDNLRGDPDAFTAVGEILKEKRAHLDVLRSIAGMDEPEPEAAAEEAPVEAPAEPAGE